MTFGRQGPAEAAAANAMKTAAMARIVDDDDEISTWSKSGGFERKLLWEHTDRGKQALVHEEI